MKLKLIAIYSLIIGCGVLGFWITAVISHSYPEGLIEISFHILSETIMAILSIIGGLLVLKHRSIGLLISISAHSMIIYSVLNAAGYYGERNILGATVAFSFVCITSIFAILYLLRVHLKTNNMKI